MKYANRQTGLLVGMRYETEQKLDKNTVTCSVSLDLHGMGQCPSVVRPFGFHFYLQ